MRGAGEFLWATVPPPGVLLMSKVSRSVSRLVAIKEAPPSSQHVPSLFITDHCSHRRPSSDDMQPAGLTFGSHGEGGISGPLGRELAPEGRH